jgi:hypothetical protein
VENDAEVARLAVPNSDPVILPDTTSDPVMDSPFGKFTNPSMELANEAVVANEAEVADVAVDALIATDAVFA